MTADELERLLQPRVRRRGLLPAPARRSARGCCRTAAPATARSATAAARTPGRTTGCSCRSTTAAARRIGYIWADDPLDRLRPDAERLQILRAFANQATTALEQAAQFEEIQNAYEHHRALIDASPVAIVDFELDGRVRSWNAAASEIFGWTAEEVIGRVSPIVPADELDVLPRQPRRIAQGETMRDLDLRRLHRDGSLIDVSISAAPDPRRARRGRRRRSRSMIDVTARKRSERALPRARGARTPSCAPRSTAS